MDSAQNSLLPDGHAPDKHGNIGRALPKGVIAQSQSSIEPMTPNHGNAAGQQYLDSSCPSFGGMMSSSMVEANMSCVSREASMLLNTRGTAVSSQGHLLSSCGIGAEYIIPMTPDAAINHLHQLLNRDSSTAAAAVRSEDIDLMDSHKLESHFHLLIQDANNNFNNTTTTTLTQNMMSSHLNLLDTFGNTNTVATNATNVSTTLGQLLGISAHNVVFADLDVPQSGSNLLPLE